MSELSEFQKILTPDEIIQEALDDGAKSFYCLLSGGKDSMVSSHFIKENYPNQYKGDIYTVTGIGIKDSRHFVTDYCNKNNRNLIYTWAPTNFTKLVEENGFFGPDVHNVVMFNLKFITWRNFEKEHRDEKLIFIGGVRRKESKRRSTRKSYKTHVMIDGHTKFYNPFYHYTGNDIWKYHATHELDSDPVHDVLNISGDCLCGCFAEKWELSLIRKFYPEFYSSIKWLEQRIEKIRMDLKRELKAGEADILRWISILNHKDKKMKKSLEPKQYQLASLTEYPTWAHGKHRSATSFRNVESQTSLEDFTESNIGNYLCSESCGVNVE